MRRMLICLAAGALVIGGLPAPVNATSSALEAAARASVLAATAEVDPDFDPAFTDSLAASSTIGTSSLQSVVWPSFLVDAFFFLYEFQSVERLALGIAEAGWPQGRGDASATLSDLAFANGGDPDDVPGEAGRSVAHAGPDGASGDVAIGRVALPGGLSIGTSTSSSQVSTTDRTATALARQGVTQVSLGILRIASVSGSAVAEAGDVERADADLVIIGATIAGTPVEITAEGVRAPTDAAQDQAVAALRAAGIELRVLPGSERAAGTQAEASSGGLLILWRATSPDPTGAPRPVTIGAVFGAAGATARAASVGSAPPPRGPTTIEIPGFRTRTIAVPGAPGGTTGRPEGPILRRRTIVTTAAAGPFASARGAYGAVMLVGLGLLFIRPLVRAASRT